MGLPCRAMALARAETDVHCNGIGIGWLQLTPFLPTCLPTRLCLPDASPLCLPDSSPPSRPAQVSGICFEFDPSQPAGSRIVPGSVELAGEPLETDRLYKASWALYCPVLLRSALYSIC